MLIPDITWGSLDIGSTLLPVIPLFLVAVFLLLLTLEAVCPLRRRTRARSQRLPVNFALTAGVMATGLWVVRPVALAASFWAGDRNFGILGLVKIPDPVAILLGLVLIGPTTAFSSYGGSTASIIWTPTWTLPPPPVSILGRSSTPRGSGSFRWVFWGWMPLPFFFTKQSTR
jgi:hypothetical protein